MLKDLINSFYTKRLEEERRQKDRGEKLPFNLKDDIEIIISKSKK